MHEMSLKNYDWKNSFSKIVSNVFGCMRIIQVPPNTTSQYCKIRLRCSHTTSQGFPFPPRGGVGERKGGVNNNGEP
jgi:hypothetical protein